MIHLPFHITSFSISESVMSLFFRPVLVVEAMYKMAKLTAKAAKMDKRAASVGTPSSQYSPCPEAAATRSDLTDFQNRKVEILLCLIFHFVSAKHRWFSGRMLACHAGGPGSIPGRCNLFSTFRLFYHYYFFCLPGFNRCDTHL